MNPLAHKPAWRIEVKNSTFNLNFKELFSYRHLLMRLVRKDFLVNYQQTLLGPLWVLFQPLLTLITYIFVFNKIIEVPIGGGLPPVLFYFSGIILWNFFNESFLATSKTFRDNISLFSKVYFPRLIIPLAAITTHFVRFLIQLFLFILFLIYFMLVKGFVVKFSILLLAVPFIIVMVGMISLSLGLIFSVITGKYRDLSNFVDIFTRILLFVTPVFYPLSVVKENIRWVVQLNPLAPLFEFFRFCLLGEGTVTYTQLIYSMLFMLCSTGIAILLFNKQGSKLIDVI